MVPNFSPQCVGGKDKREGAELGCPLSSEGAATTR